MSKKVKLPTDYIRFLKDQGLSLSEIKARLYYEMGIEVSKATLSRRLRE
jgi:intein-encoded DNA endonuclease-like protein